MSNVFVSYRTVDEVDAQRLAEAIRAAGHVVWFFPWEINVGDSLVERMNQGLSGATFLVLCLSSSGVDTPWMSREWASALARQLNGVGVKILPAKFSSVDPPPILADIRYADMTRWDEGIAALLRAIR